MTGRATAISDGAVSAALVDVVTAYCEVDPEAVRAALAFAHWHPEPVIARLVLDRAALSG